jgi:hypothetical protein
MAVDADDHDGLDAGVSLNPGVVVEVPVGGRRRACRRVLPDTGGAFPALCVAVPPAGARVAVAVAVARDGRTREHAKRQSQRRDGEEGSSLPHRESLLSSYHEERV